MRISFFSTFFLLLFLLLNAFIKEEDKVDHYINHYKTEVNTFKSDLEKLQSIIQAEKYDENKILAQLYSARTEMKTSDFWLRYLRPLDYKKINAPLPVEWEVEVFEKFEAPYKRVGTGLTLIETYLDEGGKDQAVLEKLINEAVYKLDNYLNDSTIEMISSHHHFFLANRLHLLNLAAIYTTAFECPNTNKVIPELVEMLEAQHKTYASYNQSFPNYPIAQAYLELYHKMTAFAQAESSDYEAFNHYFFIKNYVNPLFALNQQMITTYNVQSNNFNDYSLNNNATSIFDKELYYGQFFKGTYASVKDTQLLGDIKLLGKLLFFDPILSDNNERSCASCHQPNQFFTDTMMTTHLQFNKTDFLERNTPSLLNVLHNHLLNNDGGHFNLQSQAESVVSEPTEMNSKLDEVVDKVLSCKEYKSKFQKIAKQMKSKKSLSIHHISSAINIYLSDFSYFEAPFDDAMNNKLNLSDDAIEGFNVFMSKGQCATCHFVPQFNGVKPPYIGSEFEVIGVPSDTNFNSLSSDKGRFNVHPVEEMENAFRTGSIRNVARTAPYMHNGVFSDLEAVIDFYNNGGGVGHGLKVDNQTLPTDSLQLTSEEQVALIRFMESLTEAVEISPPPTELPASSNPALNNRKVGGIY